MEKIHQMLLGTQALGQLPSDPRMLHPQTEMKDYLKLFFMSQVIMHTHYSNLIRSPLPQEMQQLHTCSP